MRLIDQLHAFVRAYLDPNAGGQNAGKKLANQTTYESTNPILNGDEPNYYYLHGNRQDLPRDWILAVLATPRAYLSHNAMQDLHYTYPRSSYHLRAALSPCLQLLILRGLSLILPV